MNEIAEVRAQTVLYKNDISSVEKSVRSIANAVAVSRKNSGKVKLAEVCFGDASPEPIMDDALIASWNEKYGENLRITYQFFGFNSGTSKGQNIMFKDCNSEYLMIYNPDVVVCPSYFRETMAVYENGENIGMVEARQTPLEHPKEYDTKTGEELWGAMACVVVPSAVYKELGGLDEENFFMYCDDVDFSWRLRLSGRKVVCCPRGVVFHGHRLDYKGRTCPTDAELYYSAESSIMMAYKWSGDNWLNELQSICAVGSVYQRKALDYFLDRKAKGTLPKRLDPDHKIAYFKNGCYAKHRYTM